MKSKLILNKLIPYITKTPLHYNKRLSHYYGAKIYFKREDLQITRSFKIRGALNKCLKLYEKNDNTKIVCPSAGNHAQGVAHSCNILNINCDIFLPESTPKQKIDKIKYYGKNNIKIHIKGNNFSTCLEESVLFSKNSNSHIVHPYDDIDIIEGQSTLGFEIDNELNSFDTIICAVGGGGLISGIGQYYKYKNNVKILGVEPENANSLYLSLLNNSITPVKYLDTFADGASVRQVGNIPYKICKTFMNERDIVIVDKYKLCKTIINLHNFDGIITEPAGALSVAALENLSPEQLKNKNIVCIISGGNMDIFRYNNIVKTYLRF